MTTRIQRDGKDFYLCGKCGTKYADKEIAEKCEAWCAEHNSCNIEIISNAVEKSVSDSNGEQKT